MTDGQRQASLRVFTPSAGRLSYRRRIRKKMFDEKIGEENAEEEHPVSGRRFQPGFISAATDW
jgi:hypothetical protein